MYETSKSIFQRLKDNRYVTRYFVGEGIDIGAGSDSLGMYQEFFPLMKSCRAWDIDDGDAQFMPGVSDASYDFINSSHCLEHLNDVSIALDNWLRVLKPGGHLVCIVPDEDLYEQGIFPSTFNSDHKCTFTIHKKNSWSTKSVNILELLSSTNYAIEIKKIELLDATYRFSMAPPLSDRIDQTTNVLGEAAIEFIVQKK
ncbi:class I SAM-dependent methyltransferase [Polynucleobacter paneuropaeus]|nr:class I SAM-dependent methyltransferase [Polynucleobacter paneuropaeus]MBT8530992.1 class I SAM-dependent methyltransferase [Polynucleobacter paneuropaeus]MBT8602451.1 class I SAM-dependent methyltransferase [Polynucleobacter paneuropaeus]MBT8624404.1 class I SAM-dependent methyltransferase [Polynucleobacter paneuropaeus]MBT8628711.1 class I SAM-dependent methyltransferase [Polynucleobacter paneuropaeus]